MASFNPVYSREVTALRIVPRWFWGQRIEIRRRLVRVRHINPKDTIEEEAGESQWTKMTSIDYADVARFL